ncbi:hypothetical protein BB560_006573, partial [Smittium megazygosporum]
TTIQDDDVVPMEIDSLKSSRRGRISPEERKRRLDFNLCLYCGKPVTTIKHQPLVSSIVYNNFILPVSLYFNNKIFKLKALIDSGASENFINSELIKKLNLPETPLPFRISVETVDGNLKGEAKRREM